jgi:hypothetical protein
MDRYTSKKIKKMYIEEVADLSSWGTFMYKPTRGELEALDFIGDRYAITEYLLDNLHEDQVGWITIDPILVQDSLSDEGLDRVPMLSEDSSLQRIIWTIGSGD